MKYKILKNLACILMYHRSQNRCYHQRCQIVRKTAVNCRTCIMKFDRSNKFDLYYYGHFDLLRMKSSVASKWARKHLLGVTFILLAMLQNLTYTSLFRNMIAKGDSQDMRKFQVIPKIFIIALVLLRIPK